VHSVWVQNYLNESVSLTEFLIMDAATNDYIEWTKLNDLYLYIMKTVKVKKERNTMKQDGPLLI
jgi:hypothetical protein